MVENIFQKKIPCRRKSSRKCIPLKDEIVQNYRCESLYAINSSNAKF